MKNIIKHLSITLLSILIIACSKDGSVDDTNNKMDRTSQNNNYYIHYIITSDRSNPATITINTENGVKTYSSFPLDEIFGPVEKGFKASASIKTEDHYPKVSIKIYASVNDEPFALKAEASDYQTVSTEYIIDF